MFERNNTCVSTNNKLFKQTQLITGASGGIGSAIAKFLSDQGVKLAISATKKERLEYDYAI